MLFYLFSYLLYYLLYFYVLVVSIYISCESNRQNESHDDPMNERLPPFCMVFVLLARFICAVVFIVSRYIS